MRPISPVTSRLWVTLRSIRRFSLFVEDRSFWTNLSLPRDTTPCCTDIYPHRYIQREYVDLSPI